MKRLIPFLLLIAILMPLFPASASSGTIPTFKIDAVVRGSSVTITTFNFPKNDSFIVTMGKMGTRGIGGTQVATQASNAGGSFSATYTIPDSLKNHYMIAIRLQSPTSGYYAYNWFYNNTTSGSAPPVPVPFVIPTFTIKDVDKNTSVTIETANFPADDTFTVTMGRIGTRGINGIVIGTQDSGTGGKFTATYTIPDALKGQHRIAIRLQSPTSGYYSYNWFYNNTTTGAGTGGTTPPPSPGKFVIPTFMIESVVKNNTVTIRTADFPKGDTFTVTMGYMGTRGINGIVVDTQDSIDGGTFTATYDIPDVLKGQYRIAIRLQSPTSGYYAYNWFYNNNAP